MRVDRVPDVGPGRGCERPGAGRGWGRGGSRRRATRCPPTSIDLLAPIAIRLSGRAWLMTEGLEPARIEGPGEGGPTGVDWSAARGRPRRARTVPAAPVSRRGCAGALPRPGARVQHQPPHHPRLQLAAVTRPSPTSPSTRRIPSTSCWAPSTTTSRRCRRMSRTTAARPGTARSSRRTCWTTSSRAATRRSPSTVPGRCT